MKNILQKIGAGWAVAAIMAASFANPALAAGKSAPHANGAYGYTYGGVQRNVAFDAMETGKTCTTPWDVTGTYTIDFEYQGGLYVHDATISNQSDGSYDISGGYPAGGPYSFAWSGTGTVSGNAITNSVDYTVGAPETHMDMTGTIAPDGSMSGTWSDNYGGSRTGTWTTASGTANKVVSGCTGRGTFAYTDVNGDHYTMNVKYVSIQGNTAWFAGQVTTGTIGNGWLFVKVVDNGEPGRNHDVTSGDYPLTEQQAAMDVAAHAPPSSSAVITSGNIQVH